MDKVVTSRQTSMQHFENEPQLSKKIIKGSNRMCDQLLIIIKTFKKYEKIVHFFETCVCFFKTKKYSNKFHEELIILSVRN